MGVFLASRAATLLACLVVFPLITAGCGDGAERAAGDNAATGGSAPDSGNVVLADVPKGQIGDNVFNEDKVQSYYLTFSDTEYAKLTDLSTLLVNQYTVNTDRYVQASLRVGDTVLPSIGVRYKGNFSIWGCVDFATGQRQVRVEPMYGNIDVCQRFSLKLDLNRYDSNSRLDGLKMLNLHAMAADPRYLFSGWVHVFHVAPTHSKMR